MLKETIYSSLFILASKRNRVRAGYEKVGFVRGCCSEHLAMLLLGLNLVAPIFPNSTNPIYLRATGGKHGETTFSSAWFSQTKSDFAVLASDVVNLELVEWHRSVQERLQYLLLMQYVKNSLSGARSAQGQT